MGGRGDLGLARGRGTFIGTLQLGCLGSSGGSETSAPGWTGVPSSGCNGVTMLLLLLHFDICRPFNQP